MALTKKALKYWQTVADATNSDLQVSKDGETVQIVPRTPWTSDTTVQTPSKRIRTKEFKLRLSPDELDQLRANADGAEMTISEYIRQHTIGGNGND